MFDLDASYLPCKEEFKRNINFANVDLDPLKNKPIREGSAFAGSLSASIPQNFRRR
jgi:hypothetical protein